MVEVAEPSEPTSYIQSELGALPTEWSVVRLGELATALYGKAKPREPGAVPVVGSGGVYGTTSEPLVTFPTLVIGRKGTAGMTWLQEQPCWPSDTTFYLAWRVPDVHVRFLYHALQQYPLSGEHAKTTLPSLTKPDLENHLVPLPPLPEQRAIARVLRTVQRAREQTEAVIAATRQLKASLLRHLFTYGPVPIDQAERVPLKETEIGPVPGHWRLSTIGEIATISSGGTPDRAYPAYWGGDILWVRTGEVNYQVITTTEETITERGLAESSARIIPAGSLLMAMYGQGVTRGRVTILKQSSAETRSDGW